MRLVDIRTGATGRVVVLADGYRTNEYQVENRDGNLRCWIAAESGKKVSVQWDFKAQHEFYQVDLFVDGIFQDTCSGQSSFPVGSSEVLHNLMDEGTSIASKGIMYRHQMFFKELSRRTPPTTSCLKIAFTYVFLQVLAMKLICDLLSALSSLGSFMRSGIN